MQLLIFWQSKYISSPMGKIIYQNLVGLINSQDFQPTFIGSNLLKFQTQKIFSPKECNHTNKRAILSLSTNHPTDCGTRNILVIFPLLINT